MKTLDLSSWEEFQDELSRLNEHLDQRRLETGTHVSSPLFRGQSDSAWPLESTLERFGLRDFTFHDYYRAIWKSKAQIETITGTRWDLDGISEFDSFIEKHETLMIPPYPGYAFMVYLRHHGFPSPLIDWSSSTRTSRLASRRPGQEEQPGQDLGQPAHGDSRREWDPGATAPGWPTRFPESAPVALGPPTR
jgi:hypothetical protein